jgi:hypothetical protein
MAESYAHSLLDIFLGTDPSLASVVRLFADHVGADHYLLVDKDPHAGYFLVTADVVGFRLAPDFIIDGFDQPHTYPVGPSANYLALPMVHNALSIPVDSDLVLLVTNPKSTPPDADVIALTQSALRRLRTFCPFDLNFSLSVVQTYTEESISSFPLVTSHPSDLLLHALAFFVSPGLCERIGVRPIPLFKFLLNVRSQYNDVPYHNWFHAVDAADFVYTLYRIAHIERYLTDAEVFALLLAAICHDTDHNGLTNNFHKNAQTPFAHLAPNLPPLEHHHSCISCDLLRPLLAELPAGEQAHVTSFFIDIIMSTDMAQHKKFLDLWTDVSTRFDQGDSSHRLLLAQMIMKAADLSNVLREFSVSEQLSLALTRECRRQGEIEIAHGLPISPMCDPNDTTPLCVGQVGFYSFVAGPLMRRLGEFFPEMDGLVARFEQNLERWKAMKAAWEATKD